jgi:hypothetical protein
MGSANGTRPGVKRALQWLTFFLICLGLGYPTLNRYDPRQTGGLSDTQTYYELAVHGPANADPQLRYRLLVPELAGAIARVAKGHVGTWDPVFFGFLVVNSFFAATTAFLLAGLGRRLLNSEPAALFAASLYLLNFETANVVLSGMVDSADGFFLMAIVWSLLTGRLWWLPLWGALGAASKETFVPLCLVFTVAWWLTSPERRDWRILATGVGAFVSITVLQSVVSGHLAWPWQFAGEVYAGGGYVKAFLDNTLDRNVVFMAIWLVPLGIPRLRTLPMAWIAASGAAVVTALAMVVWHSSSPGAAARPFFSIAGPLLSLSAAAWLSGAPEASR